MKGCIIRTLSSLIVVLQVAVLAAPPAGATAKNAPAIDLVNNRFLLHLYRRGLLIPVGTPGLHKYCNEYRRPGGKARVVQGRAARLLLREEATLRFPLLDEPRAGTLRVRVFGGRR